MPKPQPSEQGVDREPTHTDIDHNLPKARPGGRHEDGLRHVVFANWRDSRHPQAGGAELYCESVARRLAQQGIRVTLLTSRPRDLPATEKIAGVTIRRRGGTFSVYLRVLAWLLRHRRSVDAVIDCQNGIPFFSPLVTRRTVPAICVIFHVHQEQFETYFRWPMNHIGRWLEGPVSRAVYGERAIAVISPSTRSGVRTRLKLRGAVHVVPCGAETAAAPHRTSRSPRPHIVCVGRLVPHKQMHLLLDAIPSVAEAHPDLTVSVIGSGPQLEALREQAAGLGLTARVTFHGQASDETRDQLLGAAWLTVNPSAGEGWGLSVIEANARGIPAVAFRVPGLQDSILDRSTGWLVDPGASLAPTIAEALHALADDRAAVVWSGRTRRWAQGFSWEATTRRLLDVVSEEQARLQRAGAPRGEQRRSNDLACHVTLPATALPASGPASVSRRTDVWVRKGDRIEALMPGTDELGVQRVLDRAGLAGRAQIRIARPADWLLGGAPLSG